MDRKKDMKKNDVYKVRTLFEKILNIYLNDVGKTKDGQPISRAELIRSAVKD